MKTDFFSESLDWTLLNFLLFRKKEANWSANKMKEHNTYVKTLGTAAVSGSSERQSMAFSALKAFKVKC
jgi:hypothetical protein